MCFFGERFWLVVSFGWRGGFGWKTCMSIWRMALEDLFLCKRVSCFKAAFTCALHFWILIDLAYSLQKEQNLGDGNLPKYNHFGVYSKLLKFFVKGPFSITSRRTRHSKSHITIDKISTDSSHRVCNLASSPGWHTCHTWSIWITCSSTERHSAGHGNMTKWCQEGYGRVTLGDRFLPIRFVK